MTHLKSRSRTPRGRGPGQLAMRRLTSRPDRTSVAGPAAWFIRFTGANRTACPLGFGGFTIPSIVSVAQGARHHLPLSGKYSAYG